MTAEQLWNARARYLRGISDETRQAILAQHRRLVEANPHADAAALLELAVHQQRLFDHMNREPLTVGGDDDEALAHELGIL